MNHRKRAGIMTALIGLIVFMIIFQSGSPTPVVNWPVETYLGLVFTIGWLSNVPNWLAYVLAALVLILMVIGFYKIGSWIYSLGADKR